MRIFPRVWLGELRHTPVYWLTRQVEIANEDARRQSEALEKARENAKREMQRDHPELYGGSNAGWVGMDDWSPDQFDGVPGG